jgi:tRNA 2-thiouridine synthesizing protein A
MILKCMAATYKTAAKYRSGYVTKLHCMTILDVKGLKCPLPVLRAKRALATLDAGAILDVEATDPAALKDFPAFCEMTGNLLVETKTDGDVFRFRIQKGNAR